MLRTEIEPISAALKKKNQSAQRELARENDNAHGKDDMGQNLENVRQTRHWGIIILL